MEETKIKIKGKLYKFNIIDCDDLYNGVTNLDTKTISINKNLENDKMSETIIHELIHAYFYECGLDTYCDDEKLVTFLGRHFFDLNKTFLAILEKIESKVVKKNEK